MNIGAVVVVELFEQLATLSCRNNRAAVGVVVVLPAHPLLLVVFGELINRVSVVVVVSSVVATTVAVVGAVVVLAEKKSVATAQSTTRP